MRVSIAQAAAAIRAVNAESLTVAAVIGFTGWRGPSKAQRAAAALVIAGYWRRYATSILPPRTIDGSFVYDRRT